MKSDPCTRRDTYSLSVIDDETQYFIAESTRTVDLVDNTRHKPGDEIWMGCTSVSKAGRLCERCDWCLVLVSNC
jgi:hypothetical protein